MPEHDDPLEEAQLPQDAVLEILAQEEAEAWQEYLEVTRTAGHDYHEVEPWAWARLTGRLRNVGAAREGLGAAAA